jgi:hypothetical protein
MKRVAFLTVLLLILTLSQMAFAQELGSLTGVVADKTGAVIPDTDIRLTDTKTNATYNTKTNSVGAYTFVKLLPGPGYKLVFTKDGFESLTISDVYISLGSTHTQNATLRIGKISETVEVSGQGQSVTLDTTDATIGNNFDMRNIHELPIQARDSPAVLIALQPGVVSLGSGSAADDPNASRDGSVTGARSDQTNITLDGLDVNDFATGQSFSTVADAPVDSISDFRGETANPLAASGRGSGAQIQLSTTSGTNTFHGGIYEYHRDTATEANTVFNIQAGLPRQKLIRNQFGAKLGGPVIKDKLFFFFNYQGRRDAREDSALTTVPLDSFRAGNIGYINNSGTCDETSRINTDPSCISFITPAQAATIDPKGVGEDQALLTFTNGRYPHANDLTQGDGINTGGFRFNAPVSRTVNDYVGRVDYNLTQKMKLFGRVSILRDSGGDDANHAAPFQFPGDPLTFSIVDHSYAYVVGHTWTISPTKVNQFFYGETRSDLDFPVGFNPTGTTTYSIFGPLTSPYAVPDVQHRVFPIPVFRDDFTWIRNKHNFQIGGTFKPIRTLDAHIRDFNFVTLGIGGNLTSLAQQPIDKLRPDNIFRDDNDVSVGNWDTAYTFMLGRFGNIGSNFNNGPDLQPLPQGTGHTRNYRYYETEVYFQDTWRMRDDLTLTYGLRYQYYSVPYETNGLEAIPNIGIAPFFDPRAAQGPAGDLTPLPLVSYSPAGKANHARGLYEPDWKDFAPRLAFAYNPKAQGGFLGHIFGDRKTVIRGGAGLIFDHPVVAAVNFVQDQASYLYQNASSTIFGTASPNASLQNDPRFTDINSIPAITPPTPVTVPFQPFVDQFGPFGAATGQANYAVDPTLKTPYSIAVSFGFQRELPGNFQLEANYFGRMGRRLIAQADAGQVTNFLDQASGHTLAGDFAALSQQKRNGVSSANVTPLPFFENQMNAALESAAGIDCATAFADFGLPNCTSFVAAAGGGQVTRGDLGDVLTTLDNFGVLFPGVGLHPQFGSNVYIANKSFSTYNALLTTLHKKLSHDLQFDLNYTYSHSIDNLSAPANNVFGSANFSGGVLCSITDLGACRGNSDFDVTHIISGNFIYTLPFGRGKTFASGASGWLDQIIGGWQLSGVPSWRSGFAFTTVSNAFPVSFANDTPGIFIGTSADLKNNLHFDPARGFVLFADPDRTRAAFRGPLGLEDGTRNNLRGPGFTNFDLGLAKHFMIKERFDIEFRADAYNAFNHVNFGLPGTGGSGGTADISDPSSFGVINNAGRPREVQFALRVDF